MFCLRMIDFFFGAQAGPRAALAVSGLAVPARKMTLRRGA